MEIFTLWLLALGGFFVIVVILLGWFDHRPPEKRLLYRSKDRIVREAILLGTSENYYKVQTLPEHMYAVGWIEKDRVIEWL